MDTARRFRHRQGRRIVTEELAEYQGGLQITWTARKCDGEDIADRGCLRVAGATLADGVAYRSAWRGYAEVTAGAPPRVED